MKDIYFDNHSTTPVDPRVLTAMVKAITEGFGNASNINNRFGDRAAAAVKTAADHVATLIDCDRQDVIFTSGATESLNLAIQGAVSWYASQGIRPSIACTSVEHKAVLQPLEFLEASGAIRLSKIPVVQSGQIDIDYIKFLCGQSEENHKIDMLCVMAANNEVGTIYPVEQIAAIAQEYGVVFLCDASQAAGKIPLSFKRWGISLLAFSGHKIYGPQGIGVLIANREWRRRLKAYPMMRGGEQQFGIRPGTLNLPGIVAIGEASRLRNQEMVCDEASIAKRRDRLESMLKKAIPELVVNGDIKSRLAGNLNVSIPGIENSALVARLQLPRLAISTGSACLAGVQAESHVLRSMGLTQPVIDGSFRIGIGRFNTDEEVDQAAGILIEVVQAIKEIQFSQSQSLQDA